MYSVTDEEIDFILDDITKKGIETEDVKFNILDHVCCIIENEMPTGVDFYEFYRTTIARFFKKELREIEEETRELTTFKYYHAMKRTLKITGGLTVFLSLAGSLFKFQHWPGAGVLILLALAFFGLVFIPLNIVLKFKDEKKPTEKFIISFGLILGMIMTIGLVFRVFHWPNANIIIFSSLGLFVFLFIPVYFITRFRNPETKFNGIVHTTFMVAGASILFALINLRPSHFVEESVASMDVYQHHNVDRITESNSLLYKDLNGSEMASVIKNLSLALNSKISDVATNLIAKSNQISFELAKGLSEEDVKNPNDVNTIVNYFQTSKDEFSFSALNESIDLYNSSINELKNKEILRPIEISNLQMENTIISVVLHELLDIQVQVLSNENSYLCLEKGMLAAN